jgi:hypothetical protein
MTAKEALALSPKIRMTSWNDKSSFITYDALNKQWNCKNGEITLTEGSLNQTNWEPYYD